MIAIVQNKLVYLVVSTALALLSVVAALEAQDAPAAPTPGAAEAPELTEEAEKAIERGLQFLLANQNADGSWSSDNGDYAIAGTSLSLMAVSRPWGTSLRVKMVS